MGVEHWMVLTVRKGEAPIKLRIPREDPILVRLRGLSSVVARGRAQIAS